MKPATKAKILAILLKLKNADNSVDVDSTDAAPLWDLDKDVESRLFELSAEGAISFEVIGEDGFAPIYMCHLNEKSVDHLLNAIAQITNDTSLLEKRINDLVDFSPANLVRDINKTENDLISLKKTLTANKSLESLSAPLAAIEAHFLSIKTVAQNYHDVYKNIIKPIQEEGRSGIRATVIWAIIGIIASVLFSNLPVIIESLRKFCK